MGQHVSREDFEWTYDEEPHATRRKIILEKYPEIKQLFGYDKNFKYILTAMVLIQMISMVWIRDQNWGTLLVVAYCFGGTINHSLMLAIHEISHNMAFGHARPLWNRFFSMFVNLPIGFPFSISFKIYHREHHKYLNDALLDPDTPTYFEAKLFCTTLGKFVWVLLQPVFYGLRPLVKCPQPLTKLEAINIAIQVTFDLAVFHFLGVKSLMYLMLGSLLAMGLHPVAGHFIAEHYMFRKGYDTYSYYGPLNAITFNVGYHNEHHDFPAVPGSKLPEVKRIAAEFYDSMPQHHSWCAVLYDFIFDPAIGPYARMMRGGKTKKID